MLLSDALGLHEVEGAGLRIGELDVSHVLLGVADIVKGDGAGHAFIGHAGERFGDRRSVRAVSALSAALMAARATL